MQTQHSKTRCPVYLHASACSSRAAIETIQLRTGLLVITTSKGRIATIKPADIAALDEAPAPFGGDAA
ncbi:hypothetical protein ACIPLA_11390 [Pseudomonas sp. NPDC086112]|uniref:hypothetical protein n=1 Tax=Pseudomonas sp. NPDC086112 TaxID=3364430 RepID=UPI0038081201